MSDSTPAAGSQEGIAASGTSPAQATPPGAAPTTTFGASRGSGLSRGKPSRSVTAPSATASNGPSDYKPTAVSVLVPEREYKNPFAPKADPAAQVETPAIAPVAPIPVVVKTEPLPIHQPTQPAPTFRAQEQEETERFDKDEAEDEASEFNDRSELDILPPEPSRRVERTTWENRPEPAPLNTDPNRVIAEKNIYRPENKKPAMPREARPARESNRESPRAAQESFAPKVAKKEGGFIAWLNGLFGSSPKAAQPTQEQETDEHSQRPHRRRHRGGRGRPGGPSAEQRPQGDGEQSFNSNRGENQGGPRRRHRGGRGRSGGGNGPRPN